MKQLFNLAVFAHGRGYITGSRQRPSADATVAGHGGHLKISVEQVARLDVVAAPLGSLCLGSGWTGVAKEHCCAGDMPLIISI